MAFREYSKETEEQDVPYYPKRLEADKLLLRKYREIAELRFGKRIESNELGGVSFLGRLATYRYMDMEAVIGEALEFADVYINAPKLGVVALFPNIEHGA